MRVLDQLLHGPLPDPPAGPADWAGRLPMAGTGPDRAIAGGFAADRPGWAFASGYQAALDALLPTGGQVAALCITEAGGNHPRALQARVEGGQLVGDKRFVFLGPLARRLFVLARSGEVRGDRAVLRLYPVQADAPGVELLPGEPAPVVPEVPHGAVRLHTPAPAPLPGDGWARYARPFRTVEDIHVLLALLAHGLRVSRVQAHPPQAVEALLPPLLALRTLATEDPADPALHRALDPALQAAWDALDALPWRGEAAERWRRDRALARIGRQARQRRLERARGQA